MNVTDDIIDALDDDGDEVEVGRYTVRLHIEPDHETNINDYDSYGSFAGSYRYTDSESRTRRPDGYDGAARKMQVGRGDWVWWQPPADIKNDREATDTLSHLVRDLIECGFTSVGLTVHETVLDSQGGSHRVEVTSAWLGAIDSIRDKAYKRSIIEDLFLELPTI